MPQTPITATVYHCAAATGADDVALLDGASGIEGALRAVGGRARTADGARLDVTALPVGDLDAIVAQLRGEQFGDRIVAEGECRRCGTAIDIAFSIAQFIAHHRPRRPRNVSPAGEDAWTLAGAEVGFRIPTVADVLASRLAEDPARALAERCIAGGVSAGRRAAERAMAALAPMLAAEVRGECPECRAVVSLWADLRELCLADLAFQAGVVLEEVHLLAFAYHWAEADILAMPSRRRGAYADCVRAARGAPLGAEAFGG